MSQASSALLPENSKGQPVHYYTLLLFGLDVFLVFL